MTGKGRIYVPRRVTVPSNAHLEQQFKPELHFSGRASAGNLSKASRPICGTGVCEVWRVRDVENLRAELESHPLCQGEVFMCIKIPLEDSGPGQDISSLIAELTRLSSLVRFGVMVPVSPVTK